MSTRNSVIAGEDIELRAVFADGNNELVSLDAAPTIYIYDSSIDTDTIEEEVEAGTFSSAVAGPLTATQLSTGYYSYTYTVPSSGDSGTWKDVWIGTVNGLETYEIFKFTVDVEVEIDSQELSTNTMVIIELSSDITNSAGDQSLEATTLYYTTVYDPLYASPDLIRLELGPWIDYIPDDTLALMAHISSKMADFIQGATANNAKRLALAKQMLVVYDSALRCLNIPGQGQQAGTLLGKKKYLGDLRIDSGTSLIEVPKETLAWLQEQRREWWRVVNAGGNIVPGQGLGPTIATKGLYDPDRRPSGRLWVSPTEYSYDQPTTNARVTPGTDRMARFIFKRRS